MLTAADPEEVLKAMEALGISLTLETAFEQIVEHALEFLLGPVLDALQFFEEAKPTLDFAIFELEEDPISGEQEAATATRRLKIRMEAARQALIEQRQAFQARIREAQALADTRSDVFV